MTINSKIESILNNQLALGGTTVPVDFLFYTGTSDTYITYRTSEDASFYGGDNVLDSSVTVIVTIHSPKNYLTLLETIKTKMTQGGFQWLNDSEDIYDEETGYEKAAQFRIERSEI